ncbi:MAG TPA: hypothetical protein VFG51_01655 [Candidatus Saccharimonadia bacterium]|nr:hypothetical protein [Candidatus Saccharimonadia bacterium]
MLGATQERQSQDVTKELIKTAIPKFWRTVNDQAERLVADGKIADAKRLRSLALTFQDESITAIADIWVSKHGAVMLGKRNIEKFLQSVIDAWKRKINDAKISLHRTSR